MNQVNCRTVLVKFLRPRNYCNTRLSDMIEKIDQKSTEMKTVKNSIKQQAETSRIWI